MKVIIAFLLVAAVITTATAQVEKVQQGLLFKATTDIRLGSVYVLNKRNGSKAVSKAIGTFEIPALPGDTLSFTSNNYQQTDFVVSDFADKIIYMHPIVQLDEVVINEHSLKSEIKEVQRGYREKSVFYTGTPHYYYLVLKPMTFIYENFKSEVKEARRFNRYARNELASAKISGRFNDASIKKIVPINDNELDAFETRYMPTLQQINSWNDYELINYVKRCYEKYKKFTAPLNLRSL